ncbi:MAG: hypothetical protein PHO32_05940 [Candidatus Cloacimonetes bacterium]|nr:hypothetical protein [Candidatus Cloacimonadota bacterium]
MPKHKLTFFNYYLQSMAQPEKQYYCNLFHALKSFSDYVKTPQNDKDTEKSNRINEIFTIFSEYMALLHVKENVFILLVTKDDEIIKSFNIANFETGDIVAKLNSDEKIGFASFVYIGEATLAVAYTMHGPRSTYLTMYMDRFLRLINANCEFKIVSIESTTSVEKFKKMAHIGATTVEFPVSNSLAKALGIFLDPKKALLKDTDRVSITFIPEKKRNQKDLAIFLHEKLIEGGDVIDQFKFQGRAAANDLMDTMVLEGTSKLQEYVTKDVDHRVALEINLKATTNQRFLDKTREFINDSIREKHPLVEPTADIEYWINLISNYH